MGMDTDRLSSRNPMVGVLERWSWVGPAIALGLYLGRLVSEWLRPGLPGAIIITLLALVLSTLLLRRRSLRQTWPSLLLFLYVFYPQPDPKVAAMAALLAALSYGLSNAPESLIRYLSQSRVQAVIVGLIFLLFLMLYIFTLAPDILPADNGEFQLIATKLGVAHPPGFPLYTMLAHLMSRLPFGSTPAYNVNLLSAVTSSLTLVLVYLAVFQLTRSTFAGVLSTLVLGTSTTFWAQATTANIRSLTAFFTALSLLALLKLVNWRVGTFLAQDDSIQGEDNLATASSGKTEKRQFFYLALLVLSLTLGISHHTSLILVAAIFGLVLFLSQPLRLPPRSWLILLLFILLGLLPLLYLPLRGAAGALGAPDDLTTLGGFLNHYLGLGFRGDLFFFDNLTFLWQRLLVMINVFTFQFSPILLLLVIAGLIIMLWRDRLLALLLGGTITAFLLIAASYRAPQTVEYMLPAYVLSTVVLGYFFAFILQIIWRESRFVEKHLIFSDDIPLLSMVIAVVAVVVIFQVLERYPSYRTLHNDTNARDYAQPLLEHAPEDALILSDWHWVTPLWYLQEVEGLRPDVEIQFIFPTAEPYAETWARRIREAHAAGRSVIATHLDEGAYANLPAPEPIEEAFLFRQKSRQDIPAGFEACDKEIAELVQIHGYRLESDVVEAGGEAIVTLAWQPAFDLRDPLNIYVHLLGSDGQSFAQQDAPLTPQSEGITLTQFRLTPRLETTPGVYNLEGGIYFADSGGLNGVQSRCHLGELTVLPANTAPLTFNSSYRPLPESQNGRRLVGYDWDDTVPGVKRLYLHWRDDSGFQTEVQDLTDLPPQLPEWTGPWGIVDQTPTLSIDEPSFYVPFGQGIVWAGEPMDPDTWLIPGEHVKLLGHFTTSRPILRDLVISQRLVGYEEDGFHWGWWDLEDGVPAMGAIPTLKWIARSEISDPRWPTVSPDAWPGQFVEPLLRIYDAFTGRPLPILDERITDFNPWVSLGPAAIGQ